jgi:phosphoribosylaminoimidazole carboxylase (NCAIR synthetase)
MNVVFLSPHFPPQYHRFCAGLKQMGANVLGIGDIFYEALPADVQAALTDYYRLDDLHDYDALVRACGFFTHRYGKIDRFESLNEHWLDTEARIRDDFNVFGIRRQTIDAVRRKSKMKEIFRQAGVPIARGRVVPDLAAARALVRETGYPIVIKPDAGVGALNTFKIEDDRQLERFFDNPPASPCIAEEFIKGELYSFDGLTDRDGRPVFYTAHYFSQGIMETVNEGRHVYYHSLRDIPALLEAAGRACLDAFAVTERFFHIEFFRTGEEKYVALEVNMRPPGGFTTDMFNWANDIDIYRLWAELLTTGRAGAVEFRRPYHCCYASRRNHLDYAHSHDDILKHHGHRIVQIESVPDVFRTALGDTAYIFRSPELDAVRRTQRYIQALQGDGE